MLPTELTPEQQQVPDLTDKQLDDLGFSSNFQWKLNAEMLGFSPEQSPEEFVEEKTGRKIKTFLKGTEITVHEFSSPVSLDAYPIAFEGDLILSEEWEYENGEWHDAGLFSVVQLNGRNVIRCCIVPFSLTGKFQLVYGKYLSQQQPQQSQQPPQQPPPQQRSTERREHSGEATKSEAQQKKLIKIVRKIPS